MIPESSFVLACSPTTRSGSWWLLLGILPAYLCFHLVLAWKLWQYWHQEVKARTREVREVKDTPESRRLLEVSEKRGWKWCLVHASSQETIADV